MTILLSDAIRRVRSLIEESSSRFWTDTEITDWINDGCRDMARRAEDLLTFDTSITVTASNGSSVQKYQLPSDLIRIHRVEFIPTGGNATQTYPVMPSTYQEMDQYWGVNQGLASSFPQYYVLWGQPGGTTRNAQQIQFYPQSSSGGTVNLYYYRLPYRFLDPIANPGELSKAVEIVEGWDDGIVYYSVYKALMKDRDPLWKDIKAEYEEQMELLINVTRKFHDQPSYFQQGNQAVPQWLYDADYI